MSEPIDLLHVLEMAAMRTAIAGLTAALIGCSTSSELVKREVRVIAEPEQAFVWQREGDEKRSLGQPRGVAEQTVATERTEFSNWTWLSALISVPLFYVPINKGEADGYDSAIALFTIPVIPLAIAVTLCALGTAGVFDDVQTTYQPLVVGASMPGFEDETRTLGAADATLEEVTLRLQRRTAAVAAQPDIRRGTVLAVFDIQDAGGVTTAKTIDQLTDYLSSRLTELAGFRVVPRDQLRDRLSERKAEGYKACYDESCQVELGKAVAAQKTLATKLLRVGDECAISSSLYDLKTETAERAASIRTPCSERALMDGVDELSAKLARSVE